MEYSIAAYTDIGIQKESNQDGLCVRRASMPGGELLMAVVCDGMGGLQKGELASTAVVQAFGSWFDGNLDRLPSWCAEGFGVIRSQWEELVGFLHRRLLGYAQEHHVQLGTTLTAFFSCGKGYLTINVGDSRIYECKRQLRQLTQDQSLVAREVASGRITAEDARRHPQRNVLLQCLGTGPSVSPVFTEGPVLSDALYLLCSDGFVHEIAEEELTASLEPMAMGSKEVMTKTLTALTETCKQRGETDNITAVLIKTAESRYLPQKEIGRKGLLERLHLRKKAEWESFRPVLLETAQLVHADERI